jgi:HAD superfamily hydrolase (TIGR01490 family)
VTLVLVDLDGTLLKGISSERLFFRDLMQQRILGIRQLTAFSWFPLRWLRRYGKEVLKKNKAYLTGLRVAEVEALSVTLVKEKLTRRICPEMKARIDAHHRFGDETVLLTGTLQLIARPLAAQLDMHHVCATTCSIRNGRFVSSPPVIHPYGQEKLRLANDLCRKLGYQLLESIAYGDSMDDMDLLESVSQPVAVNPEQRLRCIAKDRAWEIIA